MKVLLSALADAANTTDNGKLNVLGVFQTIQASSVPAMHPQMALVLRFKASPGEKNSEHKIKFVLADPDGTIISTTSDLPLTIPDVPAVSPEFNIIINIPTMVFPKFGEYMFDVLLNGNIIVELPFSVEPIAVGRENEADLEH